MNKELYGSDDHQKLKLAELEIQLLEAKCLQLQRDVETLGDLLLLTVFVCAAFVFAIGRGWL